MQIGALDAEDPVELVGPRDAIVGDVPLPAAYMRDRLDLGQLVLEVGTEDEVAAVFHLTRVTGWGISDTR